MSKLLQTALSSFNRHYPTFLRFLMGVGDVLITTSQTLIVSFGVPIVLILLLIVEHSRVMQGILTFEQHAEMASFAAWSLVLLNTILEFTIHYIENRAGYQHQRQRRASLRLYMENLLYWTGLQKHWQPVELSPAHRYRRLLRLITFSILALALAGSMRDVMQKEQGAWYVALQNILLKSSLSEMTTWAGGLLFALAAISGAQNLTAYLAVKVAEITGEMQSVAPAKAEFSLPAVVWIEDTRRANSQNYSRIFDRPAANDLQNEKHIIACPSCDWQGEYRDEKAARLALNAHKRYCAAKPEVSRNGKH